MLLLQCYYLTIEDCLMTLQGAIREQVSICRQEHVFNLREFFYLVATDPPAYALLCLRYS